MPLLELVNITKRYDTLTAVDALSLRIEPGGIYGLLGPNGAGKTTTIRMIMGVIEPDEGEVRIFGEPFSERLKDSIGYLPEERGLYRKMKVLEHLVFLGEIKGVPARVARERGKKWLERLELGDWAEKTVEALSKGMQQKVQFIATVLHEPKLILLDEPFTGLDPINTQVLKDIIEELRQDGRTVVLSTHLMEQVEKLCREICLINKGKKILEGKLADIKMRFGQNVVTFRYSGDRAHLERYPGVERVRTFGQELTVTLTAGTDTNALLAHALQGGTVEKFEIGEMSLHDIFIAEVKEEGGEANDEAIQGRKA
jgi:ABC-2 type transport system ATP-binding protein